MSKMLSALFLLLSFSALADVPRYFPRDVTCDEIKQDIENYGQVIILGKFLGMTTSLTYHKDIECGWREYKVQGLFRTKDIQKCSAGYRCQKEQHEPHEPNPCRPGNCGEI